MRSIARQLWRRRRNVVQNRLTGFRFIRLLHSFGRVTCKTSALTAITETTHIDIEPQRRNHMQACYTTKRQNKIWTYKIELNTKSEIEMSREKNNSWNQNKTKKERKKKWWGGYLHHTNSHHPRYQFSSATTKCLLCILVWEQRDISTHTFMKFRRIGQHVRRKKVRHSSSSNSTPLLREKFHRFHGTFTQYVCVSGYECFVCFCGAEWIPMEIFCKNTFFPPKIASKGICSFYYGCHLLARRKYVERRRELR